MHWLVWFASMLDGEHETRIEVMLEICSTAGSACLGTPAAEKAGCTERGKEGPDDHIRDFHVSASLPGRPHHLNQSPMLKLTPARMSYLGTVGGAMGP